MSDIAAEEMQKAHETLSDADEIRDAAVTDGTVVNRFYYSPINTPGFMIPSGSRVRFIERKASR
jgi:hypothetical protein